ncbi:hypothetical protein JHK87_011948 [Glycine soja]|nr:hypothetical protein JHK87_011948 [Glycine soja]
MAKETFPIELIVEILSWLPVKPLIRFRCVSKTWKSLISHPIMVKLHLQRSSKNPHVLLTFEDNNRNNDNCYSFAATCSIRRLLENPSSTVDDGCYQFNDKNHFVVGVCNGLVCLLNSLDRDDYEEYWVRFWNPATRTMSEDSPRLSLHWRKYKTGRNDWVCGYPRCGFGYDGLSDTYKVVIILSNVKLQRTEVRVHSVGDTRWRKTLTCPVFPFMEQLDGKFVGGTVNWLALHMSSSYYRWEDVNVNEIVIFSYDLKTQTYKYLLLPDGLARVNFKFSKASFSSATTIQSSGFPSKYLPSQNLRLRRLPLSWAASPQSRTNAARYVFSPLMAASCARFLPEKPSPTWKPPPDFLCPRHVAVSGKERKQILPHGRRRKQSWVPEEVSFRLGVIDDDRFGESDEGSIHNGEWSWEFDSRTL